MSWATKVSRSFKIQSRSAARDSKFLLSSSPCISLSVLSHRPEHTKKDKCPAGIFYFVQKQNIFPKYGSSQMQPLQVGLEAGLQLAFGRSNTLALFGLGAICRWGSDERGFSKKEGSLEYQRNIEIPGCIEKVHAFLLFCF